MSTLTRQSLAALAILILCSAPRPVSAEWSKNPWANNPVCTATGDQFVPNAIPEGAGGAIVAWMDGRSGNFDIYAQRLDADGVPQWTANGVAVCTAVFDQTAPRLVSDGAGGAIIVWQDVRNGNSDIFVRRVNAAGVPQWTADGVALCTAGNAQDQVRIVTDGGGGAIVGWRDLRFEPTGDVFAQRVDASGTPQWAANGVALCTVNLNQAELEMVPDLGGGAIAVWNDLRSGTNWDVYAQRVNAAGVPQWTVNGNVVSAAGNSQVWPKVAADGVGGVVVAWTDERAGYRDAFAQRMSPGGAVLWPGDRQIDFGGSDLAEVSTLVADGTGGAFIAFMYTLGNWEIGLTRIGGAGVVLSGPVTVSAHPVDQQYPFIVSDGSGGVIMAYWAYGPPTSDYGSMRLNSSLVQQWGAIGPAWTLALGEQANHWLVPDGAGGGILVWQDPRDAAATGNDIYAQRIDHFGKYPEVAPTVASVRDVPNDQGGQLKLSWDASYLDADPSFEIDEYRIWRSVPEAAATQALESGAARMLGEGQAPAEIDGRAFATSIVSGQTIFWEYVGSQVAAGDAGYSYVVPTTSDSIGASNPYTLVRVQAMHATSTAFWTSDTDSGYSVDNLSPAAPAPFTGVFSGGPVQLHWGASTASDFAHYEIHRGGSAGFVPDPGSLVGAQSDTGFVDAGSTWSYYKLAAVDLHGNRSGFALVAPAASSSANTPAGGNVTVSVSPSVEMTFQNVASGGQTQVTLQTGGSPPPNGLKVAPSSPPLYYTLTTTATFTGTLTVCVTYDPDHVNGNEANLKLMHFDTALDPDAWVQVTTSRDTDANEICGVVTHLSEFALMEMDETVAVEEGSPPAAGHLSCAPNPVAGKAQIFYDLSRASPVRLDLFDLQGRLVREIERQPMLGAGRHVVQWDGRGARDERLRAGVYFLRLDTEGTRRTRRVVVAR